MTARPHLSMHRIQNVSLVMNEVSFVQFLSRFRPMPNNRMQPDFGKLRLPQPLMRALCCVNMNHEKWSIIASTTKITAKLNKEGG